MVLRVFNGGETAVGGESPSQGDINDGPIYGEWIMVSKSRKNLKHNSKNAGPNEVNKRSGQNKFQTLANQSSTGPKIDTKGNKGKETMVSNSAQVEKTPKTWVRKRQRKDGEGPSVSAGPNLAQQPKDSSSQVTFKQQYENKARSDKEEPVKVQPHIKTWPDGTQTSLPLVRIASNQLRFLDSVTQQPVSDTEMEVMPPSKNVTSPKPKEPPDNLHDVEVMDEVDMPDEDVKKGALESDRGISS
ncbi:hypothetical protein SESBI_09117 [Sesbania bispinosa]|nr:hypothetical protein SESBI_09117 [Sesbania bispinosa]